LRFLIDAQLPPRLAAALRKAGHDAEDVLDVDLVVAPDIEVWRYAERIRAAIITKDSDFVALRAYATGGPAVVWLRFGNVTNKTLENALLRAFDEVVTAIETGDTLIEIQQAG
jgi:predicted nuclease of predicted toxin-antitoxin system